MPRALADERAIPFNIVRRFNIRATYSSGALHSPSDEADVEVEIKTERVTEGFCANPGREAFAFQAVDAAVTPYARLEPFWR